jgi:ubiquinone/menaquinone biosynthesis C-methylase UbiE
MTQDHAFVTFYSHHNISPVSQDITDLEKHFQRRDSLFKSLGIPPSFVRGSSVIEFGPGSGHNAIFTASLSPSNYFLVDGNTLGLNQTKEKLEQLNFRDYQIINSLFLDYFSDERFNLVWAENCIPHQSDPLLILHHLSDFTRESGIFVVTASSPISYLSETIRRLLYNITITTKQSLQSSLDIIRPYLVSHLVNLKGMSRPIDDWIIDNILQPLERTKLLTIPEVLTALCKDFDFYASSPRFVTDWRWYKEIVGLDRQFNSNAIDTYYRSNVNLIDYRYTFETQSIIFGRDLEDLCAETWSLMSQIQQGNGKKWQLFFDQLSKISKMIEKISPDTASSIIEASQYLQDGAPHDRELNAFPKWWGRGTQYLSLIRRPTYHLGSS